MCRLQLRLSLLALAACGQASPASYSAEPGTDPDDLPPLISPAARNVDLLRSEALPEIGEPGEYLVKVSREFRCTPDEVQGGAIVGPIVGSVAQLGIRPSDPSSCTFRVVIADPGAAKEVVLSSEPSGFLMGAGLQLAPGEIVVCINNIVHSATSQGARRTDRVTIDCAASVGGSWTALRPVVVPDGEWAAWMRHLFVAEDGTVTLRYVRDFSFQFMNLSDNGRPPEDGVYDLALAIKSTGVSGSAPKMVTQQTNPLAKGTAEGWTPTAEEVEALSGLIDFGPDATP